MRVVSQKSKTVVSISFTPKRLSAIWSGMMARCENKNDSSYHRYGGRGIKVCDTWKNFPSFAWWAMRSGYQDSLSIDRINNKLGYSFHNCRWVDSFAQNNNKDNNIFVEIDGVNATVPQHSRRLDIPRHTLYSRYKKGLRGIDLVYGCPEQNSKRYIYLDGSKNKPYRVRVRNKTIGYFVDLETATEARDKYLAKGN